jgi:rRNA-processing protein FCF1
MKQVLLDTSFIISSVRNKIDFFEELMEYKIIIPKQVLVELEGISKSKTEARIALKILEKNKFSKINLDSKNTDKAIILYAEKNPRMIIATLDKEIKSSIKNMKLVIRGKKKLAFV